MKNLIVSTRMRFFLLLTMISLLFPSINLIINLRIHPDSIEMTALDRGRRDYDDDKPTSTNTQFI
jgi:hypothetical protein